MFRSCCYSRGDNEYTYFIRVKKHLVDEQKKLIFLANV